MMGFFTKHNEKKDMEQLKQAVVQDEEPSWPGSEKQAKTDRVAELTKQEYPNLVEPVNHAYIAPKKPLPITYAPSIETEHAPLFVKVEKYREIVASIRELEAFVSSINHIFSLLNEAETTRTKALDMLRISVNRLEKSVAWVDKSLLRPIGFEELPHGELEVRHIEDSLSELQRELHSLRRELDSVNK